MCIYVCVHLLRALPSDYGGRVPAFGKVVQDWLSSGWCQWRLAWREKPPQCRPLNRTLTAACLCWTSARQRLTLSRTPDLVQHRARGSGGRTRGMLGKEIRRDHGMGHGNLPTFREFLPQIIIFIFFWALFIYCNYWLNIDSTQLVFFQEMLESVCFLHTVTAI